MFGLSGNKSKERDTPVSVDFQRALTQEVMTTELLRIKVLIATAVVLAVTVGIVYFLIPDVVNRVWHGNLTPLYLYSIIVPFILFEWWVIGAIKRHMKQGLDLPLYRRYIGALIETSMPTVALALHIDSMGSVAALGFVIGILVFSGSLYVMTLTGVRALGAVTPLGGLAFLVGWASIAVAAWKLGVPASR